jgi:pyruvate formate lyase activating enzyme
LIQTYGKDIKVDTNGSNPDMIHTMLNTVSQFYIDIKGPWEKYDDLVGLQASAVRMRDNFTKIFSLASKHPGKFIFRTTRVPGLTNSDLERIKAYLPDGLELRVQKFVQRND